ncbi:hypothetical protein [Hydrocoleum sp. CS-953]|uniref:hypothetical protein n=1 Tax=Hydrocoleum sp. CS-953 TaxID=1671698 RepID=UPI00117B7D10|nr:hypothetical protein [Hydrocoleum sp. CS-953]
MGKFICGKPFFFPVRVRGKNSPVLETKILFVRPISYQEKFHNDSQVMKIYQKNSSLENLSFSQSESKAKILCCLARKLYLSDLPSAIKK